MLEFFSVVLPTASVYRSTVSALYWQISYVAAGNLLLIYAAILTNSFLILMLGQTVAFKKNLVSCYSSQ